MQKCDLLDPVDSLLCGRFQARGKDGIQWRTVSLLYGAMLDVTREGYFRYYCLLMLLTISDEKLALYREADDWILKAEVESEPTLHPLPVSHRLCCVTGAAQQVAETPGTGEGTTCKKFRVKIKT